MLDGKVAIVTGGGRGIGQSIALALAKQGARVVVVSRTMPELDETVALIGSIGGQALPIVADISDPRNTEAVVSEARRRFGFPDVLVNNAGVQGPIGPLAENDANLWMRAVSVNLFGSFLCIRAVLPGMMAQGRGKIINLSGGGATGPRPNFSAYAASKAALVRLTETVAEEVRAYNIQVNAVAPGAVNTRMLEDVLAAGTAAGPERGAALKQKEGGGTPATVAAALVVFLASSASDRLTGKLVSALHDDWDDWTPETMGELSDSPWFAIRRIDRHTLGPILESIR